MPASIDYKLLQALHTVVQHQSFERAADKLHISQSAVSQRVKLLEEHIGQSVLVRSKPLKLTPVGQQLMVHFQQVAQLEQQLFAQILPESPAQTFKLSVAVNADSLAIWFLDAIAPLLINHPIELEVLVCGESRTIDKLKRGEVFGAVSLTEEPLPGFSVQPLGIVNYILVASPAFIQRYFENGVSQQSLSKAPGVAFDHQDDMHHQFIRQHFSILPKDTPCHVLPSSEAMVEMTKKGLAYCLIPELQIQTELADGSLINLLPQLSLTEDLYWHSWLLSKGIYYQTGQQIIRHARQVLNYSAA